MAEQNRDDMTEHDREAMTPAGPADDEQGGKAPSADAAREDARNPAGTEAPLVPSASNPNVPAGSVPPGGPALSGGDLKAQREREAREEEQRKTDDEGDRTEA